MRFRLILATAICLASSATARPGKPGPSGGVKPGQTYRYKGRCVTITRVAGQQVSYRYKQVTVKGNATSTVVMSGTVPRASVGPPCGRGGPRRTDRTGSGSGRAAVKAPARGTTAAPPPAPREGRPGRRGALDPTEARAMVQAHNRLRAELGLGPQRWSDPIAAYAQRWADHLAAKRRCRLEHRRANRYGENLASWGGSGALQQSVAKAVDQWATEKRIWNRSRTFSGASMPAGHYTQIIWRKSSQVGCGRAVCGDSVVVVCNYDPPGNVMGAPIY